MKNPYLEAAVVVRRMFDEDGNPNTGDIAMAIAKAIRKANEDNDRERRVNELADATGYGPDFARTRR